MNDQEIADLIRQHAGQRDSFRPGAYHFILDCLDFVSLELGRNRGSGGGCHVSVDELLAGMRRYALQEYGPLARIVLEQMGIRSTADVGELVFQLVDMGLLNKQDSDHKEDFAQGFDFHEAFERGFSPELP